MSPHRLGPGLALLLALAAPDPTRAIGVENDERRARMLYETREDEAQIAARGQLYGDATLDAYLQRVLQRVDPAAAQVRVRLLRCADDNAFTMATGTVYMCIGLLLRLQDEAELAAVLGHEDGHVEGDHLYLERMARVEDSRAHAIAATVVWRAAGVAIRWSTMAPLSREIERDADARSFGHVRAAGYDTSACARVFTRMAREAAARGLKEPPYVYADHPRLQERAEVCGTLALSSPGGERRASEFLAATARVRHEALLALHAQRDAVGLIALLADEGATDRYQPEGHYLLGEGYRLRSAGGDEALALAEYDRAIESHPDFAPAYAARGRIHARRGEREAAIDDLDRFLGMAPESPEAAFARQALTRLRKANP